MLTALPVTKFAGSETRYDTRSATSSGVPVRPSGFARENPAAAVARPTFRSRISFSINEARSSDSMYCGHTALTRMLSRATASATDLVRPMQAAFVTPDGKRSGCGCRAAIHDSGGAPHHAEAEKPNTL